MEVPEYTEVTREEISRTGAKHETRKKASQMLCELQRGDRVCLLKKALYDLRQAGHQWHLKLCKALERFGLQPSSFDPCVFYLGQAEDIVMIAVYVDDILVVSKNLTEIERFKSYLASRFEVKALGEAKYCLGIEISRHRDSISLNQIGYIKDILERFGMSDAKVVLRAGYFFLNFFYAIIDI